MINIRSSSTVLSRFSFNFTSFSWSGSASRIRIPVFPLVSRKQLLPRKLHPLQRNKIVEGQVGNAGRFFVKYYKNDSPLFLGSPFLYSPLISWKFNLRTISPPMDYKFVIRDEEKIGISEFVDLASAQQKISIAFNEQLLQQTSMIYEEAFTGRKLWTKGRRGFLVSPYSPLIFSLSVGSPYLGASLGRISLDVHSLMALSQLYEMAYRRMDNDATKVWFSELWEVSVEEAYKRMYCEWDIFRPIKDMVKEIKREIENQIEDVETEIQIEDVESDPEGNVDTDTEDDQEVSDEEDTATSDYDDEEDTATSEYHDEEDTATSAHQGAVAPDDDVEDTATSAHRPPTED